MPYVHLNELSMYYEEQGAGDAPPLILLHGAGGSADDPEGGWAALAPSFAEAFRVYLVEYRGHGRTGNPAGFMTFEQIGDDIAALAQELELGPAHIAGISDGGIVALDCAIRRPELTRTITVVGANYCVHEGVLNVTASLDPDALEQRAPDAAAEFGHLGEVAELRQQLREFEERARPAVRNNQGKRRGPTAAHMCEVDPEPVDRRLELRQLVQSALD